MNYPERILSFPGSWCGYRTIVLKYMKIAMCRSAVRHGHPNSEKKKSNLAIRSILTADKNQNQNGFCRQVPIQTVGKIQTIFWSFDIYFFTAVAVLRIPHYTRPALSTMGVVRNWGLSSFAPPDGGNGFGAQRWQNWSFFFQVLRQHLPRFFSSFFLLNKAGPYSMTKTKDRSGFVVMRCIFENRTSVSQYKEPVFSTQGTGETGKTKASVLYDPRR